MDPLIDGYRRFRAEVWSGGAGAATRRSPGAGSGPRRW